ncbi:hypothetical protein PSM7751_03729 [Pseudooceanicola marinus]|uniref:Uncharacterized protein n=1 Tax=Pseudooceanicola marinus TaxID=396013 RepID=A0A1X7A4Z2_9RHOB|nr:hypothetical protein [Pseudooceanicola marinus]SLN70443.1 hypothetical protein PSM7751_03729 [Pseudooceanicola marinus]
MFSKDDFRSIAQEFSSILAGFKLALILISYFGLGSVAKWVVSHWYPFTRWAWDQLCQYLTLPSFPDVVKDSLTALIFFAPLGITAFAESKKSEAASRNLTHQVSGAFFGFLFLAIICKDTLSTIGAVVLQASAPEFLLDAQDTLRKATQFINDMPRWTFAAFIASYVIFVGLFFRGFVKRGKNVDSLKRAITITSRVMVSTSSTAALTSVAVGIGLSMVGALYGAGLAIFVSGAIMLIVFSILSAAVLIAPRKLFITAGACSAFVLAALFFDLAVWVIKFIETAPA